MDKLTNGGRGKMQRPIRQIHNGERTDTFYLDVFELNEAIVDWCTKQGFDYSGCHPPSVKVTKASSSTITGARVIFTEDEDE